LEKGCTPRHQSLDGKLANENGDFSKNTKAIRIVSVCFLPIRGFA